MFANDIGWLSSKGITTGYTPTTFRPDAYVTRGEMAAFLQRFYNVTSQTNKQIPILQANVQLMFGTISTEIFLSMSAMQKTGTNTLTASLLSEQLLSFLQEIKVQEILATSQLLFRFPALK